MSSSDGATIVPPIRSDDERNAITVAAPPTTASPQQNSSPSSSSTSGSSSSGSSGSEDDDTSDTDNKKHDLDERLHDRMNESLNISIGAVSPMRSSTAAASHPSSLQVSDSSPVSSSASPASSPSSSPRLVSKRKQRADSSAAAGNLDSVPASSLDLTSNIATAASATRTISSPSTLTLLHSLQRTHRLCSQLLSSLASYTQSQSTQLVAYEDALTRVRHIEHLVRLIREGQSPMSGTDTHGIISSFLTAATTSLLGTHGINPYPHLFDSKRLNSILGEKPFGYVEEMEYRRMILMIRRRPSLIAFALSSFQWSLISSSSAAAAAAASTPSSAASPANSGTPSAAASPFLDPAALSAHKRSMDSVAKCIVWDLFGSSQHSNSYSVGSHLRTSADTVSRKIGYMLRMTLKMMWEKEIASRNIANQQSVAQLYAAVAASSPPAPPLPLQLFDHHSFLSRCFHEYILRIGGCFLDAVIKDIMHVVIQYEEMMDFNSDLMAMTTGEGHDVELNVMRDAKNQAGRGLSMRRNETTTSAALFSSTPPSPLHASCSRTPPYMHNRPTDNLFDLCTTLLEKMSLSIDMLPRGIRRLAKEMAMRVWTTNNVNSISTPSHNPSPVDLLPNDSNFDHPTTRLLSDFFFLNWLINSIMFPETYLRSCNLTDDYPVSSLAKRNLQAIGTVLIKLTSGSRFSPFSANQGSTPTHLTPTSSTASTPTSSTKSLNSASTAAPQLKLDHFLELHQPEIIPWLRRVVDVDAEREEETREQEEMESDDCSRSSTTEDDIIIPSSWSKSNDPTSPWGLHSIPSSSSSSSSQSDPILLQVNDLYALHGLMKGCWNAAISLRIASTPSRRKQGVNGVNATPPFTAVQSGPVPYAKLPLPPFPSCLVAASSSPSSPYSLDTLTSLFSCLTTLGDVANFVAPHMNVYVLLDSGFVGMEYPHELARIKKEWPFGTSGADDEGERLSRARDVLLQALSQLPTLPSDPLQSSQRTVENIFTDFASQHLHERGTTIHGLMHATIDVLKNHLPTEWRDTETFRPFLLAVESSLLAQLHILLRSHTLTSHLLLNHHFFPTSLDALTRREMSFMQQLKLVQVKRLFELTRPKIRRLKKFLAVKTTDVRSASSGNGVAAPSPNAGTTTTNLPPSDLACAGSCPDAPQQDRFLCSVCSRLLERRRGLLRSFLNKYVVGEGVIQVTNGPNGQPTHAAIHTNPDATINNNNPQQSNPSSSSSFYISVGIGPPLDIRESFIAQSIQDYILSSTYPEVFVLCTKADEGFWWRLRRLQNFFEQDFTLFYVYMQIIDAVHDPGMAMEVWKKWKINLPSRQKKNDAEAKLHSSDSFLIPLPHSSKPLHFRLPYLSNTSFTSSLLELRSFDREMKPQKKLEIFVSVRNHLLSTLQTMSFTKLASMPVLATMATTESSENDTSTATATAADSSASTMQCVNQLNPFAPTSTVTHPAAPRSSSSTSISFLPDEPPSGSVEDYMSSYCFLLVTANPSYFISNLQFLRSQFSSAQHCKGFVDAVVAVKYLDGMFHTLQAEIGEYEKAQQMKEATSKKLTTKEGEPEANQESESSTAAAPHPMIIPSSAPAIFVHPLMQ